MEVQKIYLDFNASTPIGPEVVEAMKPFLSQHFGNPSSLHWAGEPAKEAVEQARRQVHDSSGDQYGKIGPEDIEKAITTKTILITVMHANNEVGTIQPIEEISKIAKGKGIAFHTEAAQSVGKIVTEVDALGVDLLSVAGHKLYAPKGIGALYIRTGTPIEPLVHGADHESGRRAGTENVLLIVGLGKACEIARKYLSDDRISNLRDHFWKLLKDSFGEDIVLNGHPAHRLPNTLNVSFVGKAGGEILSGMDGVAASTGAACHSGSVELSPVLKAMEVLPEVGMGAIRFSLGRTTALQELEGVIH